MRASAPTGVSRIPTTQEAPGSHRLPGTLIMCLSPNAAVDQNHQLQDAAEALNLLLFDPNDLSLPAGVPAVENLQVEGGQGSIGQTRVRGGHTVWQPDVPEGAGFGVGLQMTVLVQQRLNAQQAPAQAGKGFGLLPGEEQPPAEHTVLTAVGADENFLEIGRRKFQFGIHKNAPFLF